MSYPKAYLIVFSIIGAAIGAVSGITVRLQPTEVILSTLGGVAIVAPLGGYIAKRQRRWLVFSALATLVVLSYIADGWITAALSLGAALLAFFLAAGIVAGLYEGRALKAFVNHVRIALGLTNGFQIVDDGEITYPPHENLIFGPRVLFIKPQNAVILEQGHRQSSISGPACVETGVFEYVKRVYDLRRNTKRLNYSNVLTADLIPVGVILCATFGIDLSEAARLGTQQFSEAEKNMIRKLDMKIDDWTQATLSAIEAGVRGTVGKNRLDDLFGNRQLADIEQDIKLAINERTRMWCVNVGQVVIEKVNGPTELSSSQASRWITNVESDMMKIKERARVEAMRQTLESIAKGYDIANGLGMSEQEIHREVLRRIIKQIAQDPASKIVFTHELHELMKNLR